MALSKTAVTRITKLIEFMEGLPKDARKHFSMTSWIGHAGNGHRHNLGQYIKREDLKHCGTTACALGWAATVPSFRRAGLLVEAVESDTRCRGESNSSSAMRFFDIEVDQFSTLFSASNHDSTPKQWAKRIRRWLREQAA